MLRHSNLHIVIVLHSIDGPNLKNPESQERLAELIDIPQIQLICSLDDMKTVYNWSSSTLCLIQLLFRSSSFSFSISIPPSLTRRSSSFARLKVKVGSRPRTRFFACGRVSTKIKGRFCDSSHNGNLATWTWLITMLPTTLSKNFSTNVLKRYQFTHVDSSFKRPSASAKPLGASGPQVDHRPDWLAQEQEDLHHEVREAHPWETYWSQNWLNILSGIISLISMRNIVLVLACILVIAMANPEARFKFFEYCKYHNYPVEDHVIPTDDHYNLQFYRIQCKHVMK